MISSGGTLRIRTSSAAGLVPGLSLAERNRWYRILEREGFDIDEAGYVSGRQRRAKGPARYDMAARHENPSEGNDGRGARELLTPLLVADIASVRKHGATRSVWGLDVAEYWRLMSSEVAKLPDSYKGKRFLERWAEIGDVKTAASDTGTTRWKGRDFVDRFKALLRQKKVLR